MPTAKKIAQVDELTATMTEAKAIYLADFTGIDVAAVTGLRRQLREASTEYQVVKNRLARRAAEAAGVSELSDHFTGPTAIAFAQDDPIAPAKIFSDFIRAGGKLSIKSGFLDGRLLTEEQVKELAKLPSREQLLGQVVGVIQAPLSGFAAVLAGLLRNLVGVVSAIEEKQRDGSAESGEAAVTDEPGASA
jgi:large subunit ribosomal protein L10